MHMRIAKGVELFIQWNDPTCARGGIEYRKELRGRFVERELWLGRLYVGLSVVMATEAQAVA